LISLTAFHHAEPARVVLNDRGIGVTEEQKERLFQRFGRAASE
jgi:signal transduction histidine kinase